MTGIILSVLVFCAVFLGIFAVNLILTDIFKEERSQQLRSVEQDLRRRMREHAKSSSSQGDLQSLAVTSDSDRTFSIIELIKKFKQVTVQAGLQVDTQKLWLGSLVTGAVLGVLLFLATGNVWVSILTMLMGGFAPLVYIHFKRKQRMNQLNEQLPEALDLMSRVLRAGQTVPQALNAVGDEFSDPVGTEFSFCYEQQNLGLSEKLAMQNLVQRTGLMEIKILVMGMLIQRQSGGNLAELLDKLAKVMRQRNELKGMVKGLTAEGRMQAAVLLGLPFLIFFLIAMMNPSYAFKLFDRPVLIYVTISAMTIGAVWIRKIVNFDY